MDRTMLCSVTILTQQRPKAKPAIHKNCLFKMFLRKEAFELIAGLGDDEYSIQNLV
jgi:hypothetical protein